MKESYLMPTDKQQQVSPGLKISRRRENILDYPCNKMVSKKEIEDSTWKPGIYLLATSRLDKMYNNREGVVSSIDE